MFHGLALRRCVLSPTACLFTHPSLSGSLRRLFRLRTIGKMENGLLTPARVSCKPVKSARPSTEGGGQNVPAAQVLQGAQGVRFNDSPVTVVGRDLKIAYYNTPGNAVTRDADDDKILEYLGELNFRSIFNENVAKRTPETGRGVIDSDWFKAWLMNLLGGIIWGTGMPGAGKTVLACIVIQYLQKLVESESKDICLLFAFCRYTERLMVIDILLAILRQLLERHPQVLPYVKTMYERHARENTRPSEAEVVGLLRQISTSGLFKQTFYILDGLDEAASDIQVDLLEILSSLPVHFFITSRPLDSLKDLVPDARFLTIIASEPDIALLIDQKIHRIPALRQLLMNNATLKAKVVSMISSKSSGMFLLASLQLDMLKGCASESDVRKAMEGLPQGLDGIYEATMARIKALPGPQADLAKRVLIWVTYAQEPLTPEELVLAVSVCPETFRFDDTLEPAGIDSILSLCCGLVQVEVNTDWGNGPVDYSLVRFVHYSAAEYLIKNFERHYPDDPHALIASTCIAFLRHYGFHDVSSQGSDDDEEIWNRFASLDEQRGSMANYPYQYWGFHATKARLTPASALEFLDDCKQYPSFYAEESWGVYDLELPKCYYDEDGDQLEKLHSIHVAAVYGIREYFGRVGLEGWTNTTQLQTYDVFNSRGSDGSTALILASMTGSEDVVAFLMGVADVDVNLTGRLEETALFAAVVNRHASVVKAILSRRGVNVNGANAEWFGDTPLTLASHTGQRDIVQLLLEAEGIDVNGVDADERTALMLAVQGGHHDIIRMLVQTKGIDFRGALDEALDQGRSDIVETMLEGGEVSLDEKSAFNSLMRAAHSGRSQAVMTVLKHGTFDVNAKDDEGCSALAHSLRISHFSGAAEALLQIPGIDVNSVDKYGTTIMMLASCHLPDASRLLETIIKLSSTSDVNAKDHEGRTALAYAASRGSREAVTMLLGVEGVDYNCVDGQGRTPLMMVVESGRVGVGVVAVLLELEGIKVDFRDNEGKTALAHAISNSEVEIFEALLKVDSISADYTTSEGLTFLMLAAAFGNAKIIPSVLQLAQFDVNAQDIRGRTALLYAVASRSYDTVATLLEVEGVDVYCVDEQGTTLLMYAVLTEEVEMVNRVLGLGLGANINVTDSKGRTALFHAAEAYWDDPDIVSVLLKIEGIDCSVQDVKGRTALMAAIYCRNTEVAKQLWKAGG
ncbi:ankyrin [Coprinopsis marcescibilis]|uniref:Ankyrin n=1 Tax=Coprinopsis marcescibilis TaxID=230819 RepID=A0A5C3KBD7_COPMA|nr:ankyrin [Coprinopsis marcescibilis]